MNANPRAAAKAKARKIAVGFALAALVAALGVCLSVLRKATHHSLLAVEFEFLGRNEQGLAEYRHRESGIVMVQVPAGTFLMGSPATERGSENDERPVHEVRLSGFLIGKREVTVGEWYRALGMEEAIRGDPDWSMEGKTWLEAQTFLERFGLRLPTEAEWEYAFGGEASGRSVVANVAKGARSEEPNGYGLRDMEDGAFEWCLDDYSATFYSTPDATKPNPVCRSGGPDKVLRGGCRGFQAVHSRRAERHRLRDVARIALGVPIGFRAAWRERP